MCAILYYRRRYLLQQRDRADALTTRAVHVATALAQWYLRNWRGNPVWEKTINHIFKDIEIHFLDTSNMQSSASHVAAVRLIECGSGGSQDEAATRVDPGCHRAHR